jgi:hypothetical protein
MPFAPKGMTEY